MELRGRKVDAWGNVVLSSEGLIDHLMRGHDINAELMAESTPEIQAYNELCKVLDHPVDQVKLYEQPTTNVQDSDQAYQSNWFTPEPYASMDVTEWLLERCTTEEQVYRVLEEIALYAERDMFPVLRFLIYAIGSFRERNIVWGVGRGSSVASYVLYLMSVHKVDSLKFNLDVREFLK